MVEQKKEAPLGTSNSSLAVIAKKFKYGQAEIDLVKQTIAVGATDTEMALFLTICKNKNLDPFSNQIYFIKRRSWNDYKKAYDEKVTIQTGIDGYRSIAERTGNYAGSDDPIFEFGTDGKPTFAKVTVYKMVQGQRVGFTASARWKEYVPNEKMAFMWNKMPTLMLGKVAEALALRKAFPNDLSGIYTKEEMDQANGEVMKAKVEQDNLPDPAPVNPDGTNYGEDINKIVPGTPPVKAVVTPEKAAEIMGGEVVPPTGRNLIGTDYARAKSWIEEAKTTAELIEVINDINIIKKSLPIVDVAKLRTDAKVKAEKLKQ